MEVNESGLMSKLLATLNALDSHQAELIERLKQTHAEIIAGNGNYDEILPTLTYYTNRASFIQRRMMLVLARVRDLKRRADRLKDYRAKQDRQVAEWLAQERSRQGLITAVGSSKTDLDNNASPTAAPNDRIMAEESGSLKAPIPVAASAGYLLSTDSEYRTSSAPQTPLHDRSQITANDRVPRPQSSLSSVTESAVASSSAAAAADSISLNSESAAAYKRPGTPSSVRSIDTLGDRVPVTAPEAIKVASIKRKGKRRVRVPKIE